MSGQGGSPADQERTPVGVLICFALAMACAVGFAAAYVLDLGNEVFGLTLGGAFAFLALGLAQWSSRISAHEPDYVEERALAPAPPEDYAAFRTALTSQPVPRSRLLWAMLGLSLGTIGAAALFPLRSLFPRPGASPDELLSHTSMRRGVQLLTDEGKPVRPDDLEIGSMVTVLPVGADPKINVETATVLVRVDPGRLHLPADRVGWVVDGVVAYSKLCTHAGCPVGLYADSYEQLVCPCHHSIFDVLRAADPVEGPAPRPLPQLPLGTDSEGYLIALGDFSGPVGPGWWGYPP